MIAGVATDTAGAPSDEPAAPSEPAHCLVVDDEEPVRAMLGDLLVMSGHTVVLVESGTEAIQRLKTDAFDVVLTDLGMPKVTGWDVARACKAAQPGLPVILVTGWGVELSREELVANGVDAVLSKPLNVDRPNRPRRVFQDLVMAPPCVFGFSGPTAQDRHGVRPVLARVAASAGSMPASNSLGRGGQSVDSMRARGGD